MPPIPNYLRLNRQLSSAGQPTEAQLVWIAEQGFDVVINLGLTDSDYSLPDEDRIVRRHGMLYIHIPVEWDAPQREDLVAFMNAMDEHRDKKIFVHCAANMRASVFIALYRILRRSWDPTHAIQGIHQIWQPNPTWQSFIQEQIPPE